MNIGISFPDARYRVAYVACGYAIPKLVVYFCDKEIAYCDTEEQANNAIYQHRADFLAKIAPHYYNTHTPIELGDIVCHANGWDENDNPNPDTEAKVIGFHGPDRWPRIQPIWEVSEPYVVTPKALTLVRKS